MLNESSKLDRAFQALADPARRGMLARLASGPATVSELAQPLAMSLPAVLQHLQALESSGLIRSEKNGRVRTCRLNPGVLSTAEQWLVDCRSEWEVRHDRFEEYVMELKDKENGNERQA
ncbi:MAG TPA: metalloregulator ArsR/SmtB family transcription factor [Sphingomicrobium sp.]|nr:metalloregulator ArsR/SmtB family transcription factor [Sphingomicrobium sp.]